MKDTATAEEMRQEALSRLEILVKHGVDERIVSTLRKVFSGHIHAMKMFMKLKGCSPLTRITPKRQNR